MRKLLLIIFIVLIIGGFVIKSSYDLKLDEKDDRTTFIGLFSKWVFKMGRNIASLTSNAIKQDWSPVEKNETKTTR